MQHFFSSSEHQHAEKNPSVIPCCSALELPGCPMVVIGHSHTHMYTCAYRHTHTSSKTHTCIHIQVHRHRHLHAWQYGSCRSWKLYILLSHIHTCRHTHEHSSSQSVWQRMPLFITPRSLTPSNPFRVAELYGQFTLSLSCLFLSLCSLKSNPQSSCGKTSDMWNWLIIHSELIHKEHTDIQHSHTILGGNMVTSRHGSDRFHLQIILQLFSSLRLWESMPTMYFNQTERKHLPLLFFCKLKLNTF